MPTPRRIDLIAFDADDTLWHNEHYFRLTETRFTELLADFAEPDHLLERLLDAERRNIHQYGFGIKGFTLSMIETALDVTRNKVPATVIAEILNAGRDMLAHPANPLPHVQETLEALAGRYQLVLITKGDLFDQERKLAQSGLGELFDGVEIVSNKTVETYRTIFAAMGAEPTAAVMVGNSLKSDIVPALEAGAWAVHIPYEITWALEHHDETPENEKFRAIRDMSELGGVLAEIG
ncbi:HAD family hydrolase [Breoghania sp.]|uniref:HAD family hydrolase n=1 Tax=Breoghania sp. TaxID=2065378 RepID=UPI002AAB5958|nr:HAD family hydrolase [Breoghania sp.]